jgi:putative acetyltransferase
MRGIDPYVVEVNGQIIAYADLQTDGYIDHFFVSGEHAREGAGRLLMSVIHESADTRNLKVLTSDVSRTAQPFFERFGFVVVERRQPQIRGVAVPNALMRKILSPLRCVDHTAFAR